MLFMPQNIDFARRSEYNHIIKVIKAVNILKGVNSNFRKAGLIMNIFSAKRLRNNAAQIIIALVLAAVFFSAILTSCSLRSDSESAATESGTETESLAESETESGGSGSGDGKLLTLTTLDGIMRACDDGLLKEPAKEFFYNMLSGESEIADYNKFDVPSFTVTLDKQNSGEVSFAFRVENSTLDTLRDGDYAWEMFQGFSFFRTDFAETPEAEALSDTAEAEMLSTFFTGSYIYNTPTFGAGTTYPGMHNFLTNYYGGGELEYDEYVRLAKEKFGCDDIDALGVEGLFFERDGKKYAQAGGIGGAACYEFESIARESGDTLVTVQFFADINRIVKSHLITYRFGEGGVWLGYELKAASDYPPYGLRYAEDAENALG